VGLPPESVIYWYLSQRAHKVSALRTLPSTEKLGAPADDMIHAFLTTIRSNEQGTKIDDNTSVIAL